MSAFDRLPGDYRALCLRIAKNWQLPKRSRLSVQNRRVRFAADMHLAVPMSPNGGSRQQSRAASKPWKRRAA